MRLHVAARFALLIGLTSCDAPLATEDRLPRMALALSDTASQRYVTSAASLAYNRLNDLFNRGEVRDLTLAQAIATRYIEIFAPWIAPLSAAQARAHLDWILQRAALAPGSAMTSCARAEILRQAGYTRTMLTRATSGGSPLSQTDLTPYPHGSWPWGQCPFPQAVQNLQVIVLNGSARVTWSYDAAEGEHFQVYERVGASFEPRAYRLDMDDCGDGSASTCMTGTRTVSFPVTVTPVTVRVAVCGGLNCTNATARSR